MSKKDLTKLNNKELSDEELEKVAGGKVDEDDIAIGQIYLCKETDTSYLYWHLISKEGSSHMIRVYEINKSNPSQYEVSTAFYQLDYLVERLNEFGAYEAPFPNGFTPLD